MHSSFCYKISSRLNMTPLLQACWPLKVYFNLFMDQRIKVNTPSVKNRRWLNWTIVQKKILSFTRGPGFLNSSFCVPTVSKGQRFLGLKSHISYWWSDRVLEKFPHRPVRDYWESELPTAGNSCGNFFFSDLSHRLRRPYLVGMGATPSPGHEPRDLFLARTG